MTTEINKVSINSAPIDPFQESLNSFLVVAFPKSSSVNFSLALVIAQGASRYGIVEIGGKQMHCATFDATQADVGRASALLRYVNGWKGVMLFSKGRIVTSDYQASQVIDCFLESCSCNDSKAHCQKVIDDPFSDTYQSLSMSISINFTDQLSPKKEAKIDRYIFPCKYLSGWFRFQKDHK